MNISEEKRKELLHEIEQIPARYMGHIELKLAAIIRRMLAPDSPPAEPEEPEKTEGGRIVQSWYDTSRGKTILYSRGFNSLVKRIDDDLAAKASSERAAMREECAKVAESDGDKNSAEAVASRIRALK